MTINHTELARKWQKKWAEAKLFESEISDKEKFFMTVPYPYISGSLHIGHARVVTEADIFTRYKRMSGKNTLFPMAFHVSGTPVLGISLAIQTGNQKTIDLYKGYVRRYVEDEADVDKVIESFKNPENIVEFFMPKMIEEFSKLGFGIDWRRSFNSADDMHQAMVEWLFHKYKEKGYLVQGKYPVLYSKSLKNAVGEDDIKDGDTSPVERQDFTLIKFGFEDGYIIAATLRPETMYGQTNMWMNPEVTYVKAKVDNEIWHVSKECAEKLGFQDHAVEILEELSGTKYLGKKCFAPFVEREIPILPSSLCNPKIGTGIVTSVPSDAPADYIALEELKQNKDLKEKYGIAPGLVEDIALIPIIKSKGYGEFPAVEICKKLKLTSLAQSVKLKEATQEIYKVGFHTGVMRDTCGPYAGMSVEKAKLAMQKALLDEKRATIFYETNRPAVSRDGGEVIVAVMDNQWFIDFTQPGWKEAVHECFKHMEVVPDKYRKRFEDVFAWLEKRPCARLRGLGTKLPFDKDWVIESLSDSVVYMTLYPIAHYLREFKITKKQMTPAFFDYVYNGEHSDSEVSKQTGIPVEQLHTMRESFDYWYPHDHRHTFTPHLSNHLSFMIFAHVASLNKKYWPKKISFHGLIMSEGAKMSKSKGNVITLVDVDEQYGADTFRAFLCSTTSVESTMNWETDKVIHMKKHLSNFFDTLSTATRHQKGGSLPPQHAWFESKWEGLKKRATNAIKKMDLRTYTMTVLYEMNNLYKTANREFDNDTFHIVNQIIIKDWVTMLAPVVPHIAEELYEMCGGEGFVSARDWPKIDESKINPVEEFKYDLIQQTQADIETVKKLAKIDKPHRITLVASANWKYELYSLLKETLKETRDFKAVSQSIMSTHLKEHGKQIMKIIPSILKDPGKLPRIVLSQADELEMMVHAARTLSKVHNCQFVVERAEESVQGKAKNASPGKPALVVE